MASESILEHLKKIIAHKKPDQELLVIPIYISKDLIEEADDPSELAKIVGEAAYNSAFDATFRKVTHIGF